MLLFYKAIPAALFTSGLVSNNF